MNSEHFKEYSASVRARKTKAGNASARSTRTLLENSFLALDLLSGLFRAFAMGGVRLEHAGLIAMVLLELIV